MFFQLRRLLVLMAIMCPALACNFGAAPPPTIPTLSAPLLSVRPVTGTPGTLITLSGAGYPPNSSLNVFITTTLTQGSPYAAIRADAGGNVVTTLTLPTQLGGAAVGGGAPIVFTLASVNGTVSASALFLVAGGAPSGTLSAAVTPGSAATDAPVSGVFITEPGLNATLSGSTVAISGSAPAGAVIVQVQDAANNILGSATATSTAAAGQILGTWQTTIAFTAPAGSTGYIVAVAAGRQASIPITFASVPAAVPSLVIVPLTPIPTAP